MKEFQVNDAFLIQSDREGQICMNCRYFQFSGDSYEHSDPDNLPDGDAGEPYGQCVRFPPVYVGLPIDEHEQNRPYAWRHPDVDVASCCGEFDERSIRKTESGSPEPESEDGISEKRAAIQGMYERSLVQFFSNEADNVDEADLFIDIFPHFEDNPDGDLGRKFSLREMVAEKCKERFFDAGIRDGLVAALNDYDRLKAEKDAKNKVNE